MLLSSGVVWRHRTLDEFRAECPGGRPPPCSARVVDELDDALAWLESLGAPVLARETGNTRTVGWRFDTARPDRRPRPRRRRRAARRGVPGRRGSSRRAASQAASRGSAGSCSAPTRGARATGWRRRSRAAPIALRRHGRVLRPQHAGGRARGAASSTPPSCTAVTRSSSTTTGASSFPASRPGPRTTSSRRRRAYRRVRRGTSSTRARCASASASGRSPTSSRRPARRSGDVRPAESCLSSCRASPKLVEPPFVAVRVLASVTHTIGGLRIDEHARVLRAGPARPSAGSTRPGRTPAASSRAATAAAWRRPSSSAASRPKPPCPRLKAADTAFARDCRSEQRESACTCPLPPRPGL